MFPRRQRLSRAAFPAALKGGRRLSSPHFSAVVPKEADGYAVIVSKKTARLAVTRNRMKRRVREALQALTTPLPQALILYPRASILDMRYDDLQAELTKLLSHL